MQDIVIVGAGPSGIGLGILLKKLGVENFLILEKDLAGSSFYRWPKEMRLITPSFTGQGFGALDLNAVTLRTSPAHTFQKEHLSGKEYGDYLNLLNYHFELPVVVDTKVTLVRKEQEHFQLQTSRGALETRALVWAAGEYQFPNDHPFPGAEMARHNSTINSWKEIDSGHVTVIGGYESGADAAYHLIQAGKNVRLVSKSALLPDDQAVDPSRSLSPFTKERLRTALGSDRLGTIENNAVRKLEQKNGIFKFTLSDGTWFESETVPVLATGFRSGAEQIASLFKWQDNGKPLLTDEDESSITENLFLIGPSVQHDQAVFCFIYKFRQRFAVVARTIIDRFHLPHNPDVFTDYKNNQMYLDDLSCCEVGCDC